MTVVSSFLATLGVSPDKASFAQANSLLGGLESGAGKLAGILGAAFAGHEILSWGKQLVAQGDQLNDFIAKTGMSGQALQALGFAAEQNGSSLEAVTSGLTRLSIQSQQAAEGSKSAQESFRALGFSAKELKAGLPTDEILARIADKIADTEDPAKRAALAFKAFGKQGAALLPFLQNGRDGIEELQEEFRRLGGGLSDEFIQQADAVNDELAKLRVTTTSLGSTLGVMLLPAVIDVVKKMTDWAVSIRELLKGTAFLQTALYVGTAAFIAWGIASLWASKVARGRLGLLGALALLTAGLEDLAKGLRGGKSLVGEWMDKWKGIGTWDRYVRSMGQGLQVINQALTEMSLKGLPGFKDIKEQINTKSEMMRLQALIDAHKEFLASPAAKDAPETRANSERVVRELEAVKFGFQENTARTTTRGMGAAAEVILPGIASASAVNEGALLLSGEKAVQTAEGKVQIVDSKVVQLGQINITAKTNASPREIGRHVKRAVRDAIDQEADDIQRSRGRRDEAEDAEGSDGDSSVEGLDD